MYYVSSIYSVVQVFIRLWLQLSPTSGKNVQYCAMQYWIGMPLTDKEQLLNEAEYHLKNYGYRGGCNRSQPQSLNFAVIKKVRE